MYCAFLPPRHVNEYLVMFSILMDDSNMRVICFIGEYPHFTLCLISFHMNGIRPCSGSKLLIRSNYSIGQRFRERSYCEVCWVGGMRRI